MWEFTLLHQGLVTKFFENHTNLYFLQKNFTNTNVFGKYFLNLLLFLQALLPRTRITFQLSPPPPNKEAKFSLQPDITTESGGSIDYDAKLTDSKNNGWRHVELSGTATIRRAKPSCSPLKQICNFYFRPQGTVFKNNLK
jgi:hypothetical protein